MALEISEEHPCTKNINRILRTEKTSLLATKKILLMRTYFLTYSISLFVCYAWVIVCLGNFVAAQNVAPVLSLSEWF